MHAHKLETQKYAPTCICCGWFNKSSGDNISRRATSKSNASYCCDCQILVEVLSKLPQLELVSRASSDLYMNDKKRSRPNVFHKQNPNEKWRLLKPIQKQVNGPIMLHVWRHANKILQISFMYEWKKGVQSSLRFHESSPIEKDNYQNWWAGVLSCMGPAELQTKWVKCADWELVCNLFPDHQPNLIPDLWCHSCCESHRQNVGPVQYPKLKREDFNISNEISKNDQRMQ